MASMQIYGLQKGDGFSKDSLPYLWKWNVHANSQINRTGVGNVLQKVLLGNALSVVSLEMELVEH